MGFVRRKVVKSVKRMLAHRGIILERSGDRFGLNPFTDVITLAHGWKYPINTIFDVGANDGGTAGAAAFA